MKKLNLFLTIIVIFAISFIVSIGIKYLYSLIVHGTGVFGWQSAFQLSLTLAIVLTIIKYLDGRKN